MNNKVIYKERKINNRFALIVFLALALICSIIPDIRTLILNSESIYFDSGLFILRSIISVLPIVFILLYVSTLYKFKSFENLVPIAYCLVAFRIIYHLFATGYYDEMILIIYLVMFLILASMSFIGLTRKRSSIVTGVVCIIPCVIYLLGLLHNLINRMTSNYYDYELTNVIFNLISLLGNIAFYFFIISFGVSNDLPWLAEKHANKVIKYASIPYPVSEQVKPNCVSENRVNSSLGNELLLLNEKLHLGIITDEEYQIKRKEIIEKL